MIDLSHVSRESRVAWCKLGREAGWMEPWEEEVECFMELEEAAMLYFYLRNTDDLPGNFPMEGKAETVEMLGDLIDRYCKALRALHHDAVRKIKLR